MHHERSALGRRGDGLTHDQPAEVAHHGHVVGGVDRFIGVVGCGDGGEPPGTGDVIGVIRGGAIDNGSGDHHDTDDDGQTGDGGRRGSSPTKSALTDGRLDQ